MKWIDILKETVTQSRVKEIEDIDIDIDDDDCRRWLKQLDGIIKSYKATHKLHGRIDTDGDINEVTEEQACLIKSKLENHDGSMVIGDEVEGGAGFFYHPESFSHTLIIVAILPRDSEWGISLATTMGAFSRKLRDELVKPNEPFLQLFDDSLSFYEPYAKMIKQFSKHCNNRVFFDNYVNHVVKRIKRVLLSRSEQLDGKYHDFLKTVNDDIFEGVIKNKFGGY